MKSHDQQHCGVCEPKHLERNRYYYGKQFTVRDLEQEQRYFLDKMALTTRAALGWGVVCGLEVEICDRRLVVQPGLALDCCGRQIRVCDCYTVCLDDLIKECPGKTYAVCLEYAECSTEEIPSVGCEPGCSAEYNRIRDHFQIRLKPWNDDCHALPEDPLPCPDLRKRPASETPEIQCTPPPLHSYLCHHRECTSCDCCNCVVLGRLVGGDHPTIDACTHRRLVYTNPMLYRLIECYHGDLAHIVDFNWRAAIYGKPGRRLSWDSFFALVRDGLRVRFDQPMDPHSISRHTFIVTLTFPDPDSGRIRTERVPTETRPSVETDGGCSEAVFKASADWLRDEGSLSVLKEGFGVEITLRGSNIYTLGQNGRAGKALDGDFIAERLPTGNGTPGGDFFDWFRVGPRPQTQLPPQPPGEEFEY
jgi:hypothetical protein